MTDNHPAGIAGLRKWYDEEILQQAAGAKSKKKYLFLAIRVYLGLICLVALLFIFYTVLAFIAFTSGEDNGRRGWSVVLLVNILIGFGGIVFFVNALSVGKIRLFETLVRNKVVQPFPGFNVSAPGKIMDSITTEMGIDKSRITAWKILSDQAYPSIEEDREGRVNLVIPPSFLLYAEKHPEKAKAILAHELGHILQADSGLFLLTETYFSVIRFVFAPLVLFALVVKVYLLFFSPYQEAFQNSDNGIETAFMVGMIIDFIILFFLLDGFATTRERRQKSEFLADTAGIIYAGGDHMLAVLDELADSNKSSVHPPKAARKEHALNIITNYKLD